MKKTSKELSRFIEKMNSRVKSENVPFTHADLVTETENNPKWKLMNIGENRYTRRASLSTRNMKRYMKAIGDRINDYQNYINSFRMMQNKTIDIQPVEQAA